MRSSRPLPRRLDDRRRSPCRSVGRPRGTHPRSRLRRRDDLLAASPARRQPPRSFPFPCASPGHCSAAAASTVTPSRRSVGGRVVGGAGGADSKRPAWSRTAAKTPALSPDRVQARSDPRLGCAERRASKHGPPATESARPPANVAGHLRLDGAEVDGSRRLDVTKSSASPDGTMPGVTRRAHRRRSICVGKRHDLFGETIGRITTIAASADGFVADAHTAAPGTTPAGTVTIRVPTARFAPTIERLRRLGTVTGPACGVSTSAPPVHRNRARAYRSYSTSSTIRLHTRRSRSRSEPDP